MQLLHEVQTPSPFVPIASIVRPVTVYASRYLMQLVSRFIHAIATAALLVAATCGMD